MICSKHESRLYFTAVNILAVLLLSGSCGALDVAPGQKIEGDLMLESEPIMDQQGFFIGVMVHQENLNWVLEPPGKTNLENVNISIQSNGDWQLVPNDGNPDPSGKMRKYCEGTGYDPDPAYKLEKSMRLSSAAWEVDLASGEAVLVGGSTVEEDPEGMLNTTIIFKQAVTWNDKVLPEGCTYRIEVNFLGSALV